MKKYLIFFALGLLACAGSREDSNRATDSVIFIGDGDANISHETDFSVLPDKIAERKVQQFSISATIVFPRMTLEQAAELEAKLKKLLPEAQEISLDLGRDIEVPVEKFYWTPKNGADYMTVPGIYPHFFNLPPTELNPGGILKSDSTSMPVWREF